MRGQLAILFLVATTFFASAQDLVFSNIENQPISVVTAEIMKELYRRLRLDIAVLYQSPSRAAAESTAGRTDGEIGRIKGFNDSAPLLVRVPTPFYTGETMAFARKDRNVVITGPEGLKGYTIARIRGVMNSTVITQGAKAINEFPDLETMFRFLELERADIAVTNRIGGVLVLQKLGFSDIVPIEPPLSAQDFYHFINVKYRDIVPRMDTLIREMKESGELESLTKAIEGKILSGELTY